MYFLYLFDTLRYQSLQVDDEPVEFKISLVSKLLYTKIVNIPIRQIIACTYLVHFVLQRLMLHLQPQMLLAYFPHQDDIQLAFLQKLKKKMFFFILF